MTLTASLFPVPTQLKRTIPWCKLSPAELLMGRKLRSNIPCLQENFIPDWSHLEDFREADKLYKKKQKADYDNHYRARSLPPLR